MRHVRLKVAQDRTSRYYSAGLVVRTLTKTRIQTAEIVAFPAARLQSHTDISQNKLDRERSPNLEGPAPCPNAASPTAFRVMSRPFYSVSDHG